MILTIYLPRYIPPKATTAEGCSCFRRYVIFAIEFATIDRDNSPKVVAFVQTLFEQLIRNELDRFRQCPGKSVKSSLSLPALKDVLAADTSDSRLNEE